ncbi:hypothetical protein F4778DRAFT_458028 [Xylariomycetidae sp. FL2044]|nr:hypothetical protein F4778DRAFT_458028 [Xylariomycetidae sp. FL2044]
MGQPPLRHLPLGLQLLQNFASSRYCSVHLISKIASSVRIFIALLLGILSSRSKATELLFSIASRRLYVLHIRDTPLASSRLTTSKWAPFVMDLCGWARGGEIAILGVRPATRARRVMGSLKEENDPFILSRPPPPPPTIVSDSLSNSSIAFSSHPGYAPQRTAWHATFMLGTFGSGNGAQSSRFGRESVRERASNEPNYSRGRPGDSRRRTFTYT